MNIYTLNRKNEQLLSANMALLPFKTFADLMRATSAVLPDLILIDEEHAKELMSFMDTLPTSTTSHQSCAVIVLVSDQSTTTIRSWTSIGAKSAWMKSDWEEQLMESYGLSEREEPTDRSRHYNNKSPLVVAVASSFTGNGSTHTAFMIAKYLESNYSGKVAVVEAGPDESTFTMFQRVTTGQTAKMDENGISFKYKNLFMISSGMDPALLDQFTRSSNYDFVVLDMGVLTKNENPHLFFNADLPVLLSSPMPWRIANTVDVLSHFTKWNQQDVRVVLPFAGKAERSFVSATMPDRFVSTLSAHTDPFRLNADVNDELYTVLSPILPKSKRRLKMLNR